MWVWMCVHISACLCVYVHAQLKCLIWQTRNTSPLLFFQYLQISVCVYVCLPHSASISSLANHVFISLCHIVCILRVKRVKHRQPLIYLPASHLSSLLCPFYFFLSFFSSFLTFHPSLTSTTLVSICPCGYLIREPLSPLKLYLNHQIIRTQW